MVANRPRKQEPAAQDEAEGETDKTGEPAGDDIEAQKTVDGLSLIHIFIGTQRSRHAGRGNGDRSCGGGRRRYVRLRGEQSHAPHCNYSQ